MDDIPPRSYGPLIETTLRIITWNVWGLSGPRGLIQVYGLVMDAWWFDQSQARQDAVRELLTCVNQAQDKRAPLIVCGDFNADPDSDEIRMLTGRTAAPVPGLSFCDAW